jgi:hypothetical protein
VDRVAVYTLYEYVRRQAMQHRLPFGGIGRTDDEPGRSQIVLVRRNNLLLCLARGKRADAQ